ncbi:MAG: Smr/MutS family protein [Alphaproteobacteria bacterium]|nr:Smr/MutS family protein [Alphaproteobacteria bacterium]
MNNIWDDYKKGVKPLASAKRSLPKKRTRSPPVEARRQAESGSAESLLLGPSEGKGLGTAVSASLERRREKAVRRGTLIVEARLDLHGKTQSEAFEALADFMRASVCRGYRRLLIVTGKGRLGKGVLRDKLKEWLGRLPEASRIMALRQAAPRHGGAGAFYVLLKKG